MENYLFELGVIHTVLILGYWFFLRNERQYGKMRVYLILSTLAAVIIPLLSFPQILFKGEEPLAFVALEVDPGNFTVVATSEPSFWNQNFIPLVYLVISTFFLYGFVKNVFHILILERRSNYQLYKGLYIRRVPNIKGSFTFFNWIFLGNEIKKGHEDFEVILKHEKAHARLGHTWDLLFFELFRVCCWWMPSVWYIRQEIKKIHEYQADAEAIKSYDPDQYSSVLISSTLKINGLSLASSFHDGLILKRLKVMKQQVRKISPWKLGVLSIMSALIFVVFACNEEMDNEIKKIGDNSNAITFDQLPAEMQNTLKKVKDDLTFISIAIPPPGIDNKSSISELKDLDPETIYSLWNSPKDEVMYVALKKDGANFDYLANKSKIVEAEDSDPNNPLFTIVEEQPEYPGGLDLFYQYVSQEMQYPLEARNRGIEGRVYVQFVVEKDGSISNVAPVKGIGGGCDEEAVRVIENAGVFKPGKQRGMPVRVRMVMPIIFKLDPEKLNDDNTIQGTIIIDKASTNGGKIKVDAAHVSGIWKGKVLSPEGDALAGANVIVAGGTTGTITDLDGKFQLKTNEKENLNISFVGYETVLLKGKE